MQVYPNRFQSSLEKGLKPFYLIFGDEPQQKLESIEAIRTLARSQGFDERQSLVVDNQFEWQQLIDATMSMSLFSAKQLIELEISSGKPGSEGSKVLIQLAEQANADTILVLHGDKIGKDVQNSKWFKALDKQADYVPCYPLEGSALQRWVGERLQKQGFKASHEQVKTLSDFCEGNMLAARQEIDKLALLYPDGQLTNEQLSAALIDQSRFNVFQLIDTLLQGDAQKAIRILYRLESEGLEPTIILWALVREWQTLSQLKYKQMSGQPIQWQQFRIWRNRQGFYQNALSRLSPSDLQQLQTKLAQLDAAIKQTSVSRVYIEIAHLCLAFIGLPVGHLALSA